MKTPSLDNGVVDMTKQKTKHGIVAMLKATDPVVKGLRKKARAVHYDQHATRHKFIFGVYVGIPAFISGVIAAAKLMNRRSS